MDGSPTESWQASVLYCFCSVDADVAVNTSVVHLSSSFVLTLRKDWHCRPFELSGPTCFVARTDLTRPDAVVISAGII